MVKYYLIILLPFFVNSILFGQYGVSFQKNIDIYKPYTELAQEYSLINNKISSETFEININYNWKLKNKNTFHAGLSLKNIKHITEDKIKAIEFYQIGSSGFESIDTFSSVYDLIYKSNSIGLNFNYGFEIFKKKKIYGIFGFQSSIYFLEFLSSSLEQKYTEDVPEYPFEYNIPSLYITVNSGFFLSSINLSTYYRHVFQLHEKFSLAARVSIGTNLYSDWDQFKKYAWLGLGLEMGFGKVRELKKKEKPVKN